MERYQYFQDHAKNEAFHAGDVIADSIDFNPRLFDLYEGNIHTLHAKVLHVGIPKEEGSKKVSHVMRLVSIENPYLEVNPLVEGEEGITLFVMGGGASDAITGLAMAANALDADNITRNGKFRIKNIVILSHPDSAPRSVEVTDHDGTLQNSARIVTQAINLAKAAEQLEVQSRVKMLGHSMGAQMEIEMAEGLDAQELILIEPSGIARFPNMKAEFLQGTVKATYDETLRQGFKRRQIVKRIMYARDILRRSFTDPYGPYLHAELSLIARMLPWVQQWNPVAKDNILVGKRFGIRHVYVPAAPNLQAINHDNTYLRRRNFDGKVTIVEALGAHVTNALETRSGFTRKQLATDDQEISQIVQGTYNKPRRTSMILTEEDLTDTTPYLQKLYERTAKADHALLTELYPDAIRRRIIMYQGLTHAGMLHSKDFYRMLFTELKSDN